MITQPDSMRSGERIEPGPAHGAPSAARPVLTVSGSGISASVAW